MQLVTITVLVNPAAFPATAESEWVEFDLNPAHILCVRDVDPDTDPAAARSRIVLAQVGTLFGRSSRVAVASAVNAALRA